MQKWKYITCNDFYEVDFNNVLQGFYTNDFFDWFGGIRLLKIKDEPYTGINLDIRIIKENLDAYINSRNINNVSINDYALRNMDYKYGLDIYESLIEMVKEGQDDKKRLDIRAFQVIMEHKKCLKYIIDNLYLNCRLSKFTTHNLHINELFRRLRNAITRINTGYFFL